MEKNNSLKFRRVVLKISGEALKGEGEVFNQNVFDHVASEIEDAHRLGAQLGVVVGGGNILRGEELTRLGLDRNRSDYSGMIATIINALVLQSYLHLKGIDAEVQSGLEIPALIEPVDLRKTFSYLDSGKVVIFAAGTGRPCFTTDTAATLRACEIGADAVLKATKVDGVYDKDPEKFRDAKLFQEVSYNDVLKYRLNVMDMTAISMCRENNIPIVVFNLFRKGSLAGILKGEKIGTLVKGVE